MKMNVMMIYSMLLSVFVVGVAQAITNPGFDIINKSGGPITILVNNGYKNIKKVIVKTATTLFGKTLSANNVSVPIDINEPTLLVVYEGAYNNPIEPFRARGGDEGTQKFFFDWLIVGPKATNYLYHFKPGKDIYVTLHKGGSLDPQTGPQGGSKGVTEAGYPLQNRVSPSDIIKFDEQYSDYITRR